MSFILVGLIDISTTNTDILKSTFDLINKMSWRQQGSTGSNNIPLGNRRRFGGDGGSKDDNYSSAQPSNNSADGGSKRGRSPVRCEYYLFNIRSFDLISSL
jgi:hypothetical protein